MSAQPVRITAFNGPWPLLAATAARSAEAAALALHPGGTLLARAGLALARLAQAQWPHAQRVLVWAGPGNNGGDGLVAATQLHRQGREVTVLLLAEPGRLPTDAAAAWKAAQDAGVDLQVWAGATPPAAHLAIDALVGLGSSRAPEGLLADAIALMNVSPSPVLSVDLPSGLHPETGALLGREAVRAQATLSFLSLKPGCFTHQGRDHAGTVWLDDLGHAAANGTAWLAGPALRAPRGHATHKGSYGDVAVVGGAAGMTGAAWLAASAALAAGAGRVYASLLDANAGPPRRLELMTRQAWWRQTPAVLQVTTTVAGCGGGEAIRQALPALITHASRLVLDADALNAIASDGALATQLRQRRSPALLTPHPLEAARLLCVSTADVQQNRLAAAQALAERTHAAVLLKGSGTVVAAPGVLPSINPTGNAALATAGSGDVLAGWAAGLWATAPDLPAVEVACRAAWQHGEAADRFAAAHPLQVLRAGELIDWLAR